MNIRIVLFLISGLIVALPVTGNDTRPWEAPEFAMLDRAHAPEERPHERLLPAIEFDWKRERERIVEMVCSLGLIALALVDCEWSAEHVLPVRQAPEYRYDINDKALKARMKSI
jgi:hypothetical protein